MRSTVCFGYRTEYSANETKPGITVYTAVTTFRFSVLTSTVLLLFTPRPVTHAQKPQNSGFAQVALGFVTQKRVKTPRGGVGVKSNTILTFRYRNGELCLTLYKIKFKI